MRVNLLRLERSQGLRAVQRHVKVGVTRMTIGRPRLETKPPHEFWSRSLEYFGAQSARVVFQGPELGATIGTGDPIAAGLTVVAARGVPESSVKHDRGARRALCRNGLDGMWHGWIRLLTAQMAARDQPRGPVLFREFRNHVQREDNGRWCDQRL